MTNLTNKILLLILSLLLVAASPGSNDFDVEFIDIYPGTWFGVYKGSKHTVHILYRVRPDFFYHLETISIDNNKKIERESGKGTWVIYKGKLIEIEVKDYEAKYSTETKKESVNAYYHVKVLNKNQLVFTAFQPGSNITPDIIKLKRVNKHFKLPIPVR